MVRARIRSGTFIALTYRVLAVASHPATWQRQCKAAELSVPGSALADRSAGLVHELAGFRVSRPALVAPPNANARTALADVRRSSSIDATVVGGLRVTTLCRTLFDLLACSPLQFVERTIDDVLASRRLTVQDLIELKRTVTSARLPNVATWRALIEERSAGGWQPPESELESRLDRVLRGLPAGVLVLRQGTPPWWDPAAHRVDAYLPEWGLIIEADGRRWHTRVADFDRDRWRDNLAVAHGHRVLRFTHTHLTRHPNDVLRLVIEAGRHPIALLPTSARAPRPDPTGPRPPRGIARAPGRRNGPFLPARPDLRQLSRGCGVALLDQRRGRGAAGDRRVGPGRRRRRRRRCGGGRLAHRRGL